MKKLQLFIYYCIGNVLLRHFYRSDIFSSKYFSRPGSKGWKWLFECFFWQKIIGINRHVPWPVSFKVLVVSPENIVFDYDDLHNFMSQGNYFQATGGRLVLGSGVYIAPNVGLIVENHDINDPSKRGGGKDVIVKEKCWIGMNSMILPGVELGEHTVVGAGSIVTKSFPQGHCVIAGNPAKIIKDLTQGAVRKNEN